MNTPEGLPRVTKTLLETYSVEFSRRPDILAYLNSRAEYVFRTNPEIVNFMAGLLSVTPPDSKKLVSLAGLGVYELLREQAEANNLEKTLTT